MQLSEIIKKRREELHMTQEELAEKLSVSRQAVSKWESGQALPGRDKTPLLSQVLKTEFTTEPDCGNGGRRIRHLTAFAIVGWIVALLTSGLAVALGLDLINLPGTADGETSLQGVFFFDAQGVEIVNEANWYTLSGVTDLVVTYRGTPESVAVYLTPTGTEAAELREQIAIKAVERFEGFVLIRLDFTDRTDVLGHLTVSLEKGDKTVTSEYYNVYYERSRE